MAMKLPHLHAAVKDLIKIPYKLNILWLIVRIDSELILSFACD
jgi:hypothetical protein